MRLQTGLRHPWRCNLPITLGKFTSEPTSCAQNVDSYIAAFPLDGSNDIRTSLRHRITYSIPRACPPDQEENAVAYDRWKTAHVIITPIISTGYWDTDYVVPPRGTRANWCYTNASAWNPAAFSKFVRWYAHHPIPSSNNLTIIADNILVSGVLIA